MVPCVMLRPTPEQLKLLSPFERVSFEFADRMNRDPRLKKAAHAFLSTVGKTWVKESTDNLLHTFGDEHVANLKPDRGVFFVANHRSFFDYYVIASKLLRIAPWIERMYFPVRSNFFYEQPLGVFVNMVMSAMAMYPPVMREGPKRPFNTYTVDVLTELVKEPGVMVGFHPEGTRNKGDDPYTLLPANLGAGAIIHQARPIVMPIFTLGLINNFPKQIWSNFDGTGEPVTMVFGPPLDMQRFYDEPARPRTYKAIAEYIRDELTKLGEVERDFRAREGLPPKGPPRRASTPPTAPTEGEGERSGDGEREPSDG